MTDTDRMQRFIDVLASGGTLVIHPDTWTEMKAHPDKLPPVLAAIVRHRRIDVITSEFLAPDDMLAVEPRTFDEFPKLWTAQTGDVPIRCADARPIRWELSGLAGA